MPAATGAPPGPPGRGSCGGRRERLAQESVQAGRRWSAQPFVARSACARRQPTVGISSVPTANSVRGDALAIPAVTLLTIGGEPIPKPRMASPTLARTQHLPLPAQTAPDLLVSGRGLIVSWRDRMRLCAVAGARMPHDRRGAKPAVTWSRWGSLISHSVRSASRQQTLAPPPSKILEAGLGSGRESVFAGDWVPQFDKVNLCYFSFLEERSSLIIGGGVQVPGGTAVRVHFLSPA